MHRNTSACEDVRHKEDEWIAEGFARSVDRRYLPLHFVGVDAVCARMGGLAEDQLLILIDFMARGACKRDVIEVLPCVGEPFGYICKEALDHIHPVDKRKQIR